MKDFADLAIQAPPAGFVGTKINVNQVKDIIITVFDFKIAKSKYQQELGEENYTQIQIAIGEMKYVVFTTAKTLTLQLQQIPKPGGFPFKTIIKKVGERLEFTSAKQ